MFMVAAKDWAYRIGPQPHRRQQPREYVDNLIKQGSSGTGPPLAGSNVPRDVHIPVCSNGIALIRLDQSAVVPCTHPCYQPTARRHQNDSCHSLLAPRTCPSAGCWLAGRRSGGVSRGGVPRSRRRRRAAGCLGRRRRRLPPLRADSLMSPASRTQPALGGCVKWRAHTVPYYGLVFFVWCKLWASMGPRGWQKLQFVRAGTRSTQMRVVLRGTWQQFWNSAAAKALPTGASSAGCPHDKRLCTAGTALSAWCLLVAFGATARWCRSTRPYKG